MLIVQLSLPIATEGQYVELRFGVDIPASEITTLSRYNAYMLQVRQTTILCRGMGGLKGLHLSQERGFEIRSSEWSDAELHELLHVLRKVTLDNESASYKKVSSILCNRFPFENVRGFIAGCDQAYKHGECSFYMQVAIDDQRLFDESILRLWLNGTQYHSDIKKAELWAQLEATISVPSARALIISQLHSKTFALLNIDYIVKQVLNS